MKFKSFRIKSSSFGLQSEFDDSVNDWLKEQKTPIIIEHISSISEGEKSYPIIMIFYSTRKDKLDHINYEQDSDT